MKPLETDFTRNGWHHRQIERQGLIALFRRTKDTSQAPHFEVIRIQEHATRVIAGQSIPAAEGYPSDASWGSEGFTYGTESEARTKFSELVSKEPERLAGRERRRNASSLLPQ